MLYLLIMINSITITYKIKKHEQESQTDKIREKEAVSLMNDKFPRYTYIGKNIYDNGDTYNSYNYIFMII